LPAGMVGAMQNSGGECDRTHLRRRYWVHYSGNIGDRLSQRPASEKTDGPPAPPPIRLATLSYASADLGREVRAIAVAQRQVIWTLLAGVVLTVGWPFVAALIPRQGLYALRILVVLSPAVFLGLAGLMIVCVYRLSMALGQGVVLRMFYMLTMLIPFINIFALQNINHHATRALRRYGVRVGLMGARIRDLP
jgi:hypothetical protein